MRVHRPWHLILVMIALASATGVLAADPADIDGLLTMTGATLEWDEFTRTGILWGASTSIGFTPDDPVAVDGFVDLFRVDPIVYARGRLLVPDATRAAFAERLGVTGDALRVRPIKAIVIDPGHGGRDPGANRTVTVDGKSVVVTEKDLVLDIGIRLRDALRGLVAGPEIHLSRETDVYMTLGERTEFANSLREHPLDNILFVSIHVNASPQPWTDARGVEIYYLPPSQRRQVLEPEVAAGLEPGVMAILNDLKEEEYTVESVLMGQAVLNAISERLPQTPVERGVNVANFFVVREARMPSILVETGFINNREDLAKLMTPTYRQQLADAIALGIARYVRDFESVR
ncbi:MAG: N-acetylmuramoyl-L-alanine amidase [Spirochaetaceae bacterium]|nr:MAG: N-acetylmuramoyl-L-alanine amidase [Spirochaetaceae bacterium]